MDAQPSDRKECRITVRIAEKDLATLKAEALRRNTTVGGALRLLIRELLAKK